MSFFWFCANPSQPEILTSLNLAFVFKIEFQGEAAKVHVAAGDKTDVIFLSGQDVQRLRRMLNQE